MNTPKKIREDISIGLKIDKTRVGISTDKYDIVIMDTSNQHTIGYFCVKHTPGENTAYITEITSVTQYPRLAQHNQEKYHEKWSTEEVSNSKYTSVYRGYGSGFMLEVIRWIAENLKDATYIGIYCSPGRESIVGKLLESVVSNTHGIIQEVRGGSNDRAWDIQLYRS